MILFFVYGYGGHCGHEVIESVHTERLDAQLECHRKNVEFGKYMSGFDGSTCEYFVVGKKIPNSSFNLEDCDYCEYNCECTMKKQYKTEEEYKEYNCECTMKKQYKTEEEYKHYWREERKDHNQNHSVGSYGSAENCEFCKEDLERHKRLEQI
jgi:hypothetical protein